MTAKTMIVQAMEGDPIFDHYHTKLKEKDTQITTLETKLNEERTKLQQTTSLLFATVNGQTSDRDIIRKLTEEVEHLKKENERLQTEKQELQLVC